MGRAYPGYRSREIINEDINLAEAELSALEKKKQEVVAARALRSDPGGKKKPESQVVKEECEKLLAKKWVTVEDVFDEVAEILGKTPDNVRQLYYYKAKKTPRKV